MQKRILSTILAIVLTCALLPATAAASERAASLDNFQKTNTYRSGIFTDVSDKDWFAGNVQKAYEYGLMGGSGTKFSPKSNITLAQVLAIICRMNSIYQTGAADFKQGNPWYQVYADYAVEKGIISTNPNRNYNGAATRREVAEMLAKALPDALAETNRISDGAIPDVAAGSAGYSEIYALYRAGIAGGSGSNHAFSPDTQISRAETAAMITRMINAAPRLELQLQPAAQTTNNSELTVDPLWKGKTTSGTIPAVSDKATSENVLALLDQYDPDGAFILRKSGGSFMSWFSTGSLLERIDTAVHEQCHHLSFTAGGFGKETYYTGNGTMIPVTETKIYPSNEMIPSIPAELKTFRFDYVTDTKKSSVAKGVYGLMNEYTAYSWGMNNTVSLYEYYKTHAKTASDWEQYVNMGANDRMAYAEFRYYILTYMLYAKDHYPDVYQGITNNQDFKKAFQMVDTIYTNNVQKFEDTLSDMEKRLPSEGYSVSMNGDLFSISDGSGSWKNGRGSLSLDDILALFGIGDLDDSDDFDNFNNFNDSGNWGNEPDFSFGGGISIFTSDYQKLMNAMKDTKYQTELAILKGAAQSPASTGTPSVPDTTPSTVPSTPNTITTTVPGMPSMPNMMTTTVLGIPGWDPVPAPSNSNLAAFTPVPMKDLANRKSLQRKATDEQLAQAYDEAVKLVAPYAGLSLEEQLRGIAGALRERYDSSMTYSMETSHYNDPYGYFIEGAASCAGCTRATGLCLNILGIPYEHVNENQYTHQWCRVNVNGTYWICDAYGLYCGPEPAAYEHPRF